MMFQILSDHLFSDVARAPCSVANRPEVSPPISFVQFWIFLLQQPRRAPFESFDQIRERLRWWILNVHVHMIFAHDTCQYLDIFGIADLNQEVTTPHFDVTRQDMVAILRGPDQMRC